MKGSGNDFSTVLRKLYFFCLPTCGMRSRYIKKHKYLFRHIGKGVMWQPRNFPSDPELISIGDNVKIAANVTFINHDTLSGMLNQKYKTNKFKHNRGCIKIGNNVMIGARVMILPNVQIGNNVVIGAGSIVTKDIPDNSVAAGVPCRVVGSFEALAEKREKVEFYEDSSMYWKIFEDNRK